MNRAARKQIGPIWLVIIGVFSVSYSGPMVKGALMCGASPASVAFLRMLSASLIMLPFSYAKRKSRGERFSMTREEAVWTVLASVFLAGHYLTWITSLTATSTFASVALVCTQPIFVALFSYILFGETIPKRAVPGALVALSGALLIALAGFSGEGGKAELNASLLALAGAALMAAHWLTGRHIRRTLPAGVYTPILYLITSLALLFTTPFLGGFVMPASALPYMAGLVLGSTLMGHALFTLALSRVSAGTVSFALLGEPVGAMLFSMLLFGEKPSWPVLAGGAVTIIGLCLYMAFAQADES